MVTVPAYHSPSSSSYAGWDIQCTPLIQTLRLKDPIKVILDYIGSSRLA